MLSVFRPLNLVVVGLISLLYMFLCKSLGSNEFSLVQNIVLTVVSILIAAGGYLINDILDEAIDRVNRPEKKLPFSRKVAYNIYLLLAGVSISMAVILFDLSFAIVFVVIPIWLLWLYSFLLKRLFVIGNIVVSIVSLMLPVGFLVLNDDVQHLQEASIYQSYIYLFLSSVLLVTMAREIIKDIEDLEGDKKFGCKTLPVLTGETFAAVIAVILLMIVSFTWLNLFLMDHGLSWISVGGWSAILTLAGLILAIGAIFTHKPWKQKAKHSSLLLKIAMLFAILTGFLI